MKNIIPFLLAAVGVALWPAAGFADFSNPSLDTIVVTEQFANAQPNALSGRTAAVYDGGYIEAGDPIAGDPPPSPAIVGQAMRNALQRAGVTIEEHGGTPDLLITYHWGVIRHASGEHRAVTAIDPLYRARLYLTAPARVAANLEENMIDRQTINWSADRQQALQAARDARYFVIVSAYDYSALAKDQHVLVWRTRISSPANQYSARQAIPALAAATATYLGHNADQAVSTNVPLTRLSANDSASPFPTQPDVATTATDQTIRQILKQETNEFSGGPLRSNR